MSCHNRYDVDHRRDTRTNSARPGPITETPAAQVELLAGQCDQLWQRWIAQRDAILTIAATAVRHRRADPKLDRHSIAQAALRTHSDIIPRPSSSPLTFTQAQIDAAGETQPFLTEITALESALYAEACTVIDGITIAATISQYDVFLAAGRPAEVASRDALTWLHNTMNRDLAADIGLAAPSPQRRDR